MLANLEFNSILYYSGFFLK